MIARRIAKKLTEALEKNASVALMGPRQIGKTTMAFEIADQNDGLYLDLERKCEIEKIREIEAFHLDVKSEVDN